MYDTMFTFSSRGHIHSSINGLRRVYIHTPRLDFYEIGISNPSLYKCFCFFTVQSLCHKGFHLETSIICWGYILERCKGQVCHTCNEFETPIKLGNHRYFRNVILSLAPLTEKANDCFKLRPFSLFEKYLKLFD